MRWFKFYGQDWHTDPKIAGMGMEDRLCLVALFTIAASEEKNGFIPSLSEESLIKLAGIPDWPESDYNPMEKAIGVLNRYETLRIVTLGGNAEVTVRNWGVRQGGNTSNAEKQRRYRERLKIKVNEGSNVTVTESNAVVTPLPRIEENRIDKNNTSAKDAQIVEVKENAEELPKKESIAKYPDARKVFTLFGDSEDKLWARNTTQLRAAQSLFESKGIEELTELMTWYKKNRTRDFCPQFDDPNEWAKKYQMINRFFDKINL